MYASVSFSFGSVSTFWTDAKDQCAFIQISKLRELTIFRDAFILQPLYQLFVDFRTELCLHLLVL